jgi:hypothetical protein
MKKKPSEATINVRGTEITVIRRQDEDYISLTDIAKSRNPEHPDDLIRNWLRNRNTLELLGIWEQLHNPGFNPVEFDGIKKQAGLNSFTLTPKQWVEQTNAIGIVSKAGRYGGTYAHTDAIQTHLIPKEVTAKQAAFAYAEEADLLNVALFGQTAREWRDANPGKDGNMRDHASLEQLLVLANLENMNAEFIHMGLPQGDRLKRLNQIAIRQMQTLTARTAKQLEGGGA